MSVPVPFHDLRREVAALRPEIEAAVGRVLDSGWFVLGEELARFEAAFARYLGLAHAVGVGNGTDAVQLALEAVGVGPGDEVVTVPNTAEPTCAAIAALGARPVFVDIDPETMMLDPEGLAAAITPRTAAIVPVHLFGHPAPMDRILEAAGEIPVVEDCAQAVGARLHGRGVGRWGRAGSFSFYPSKNLGAYGDGGAVVTDDPELDDRLRLLRNYGQRVRYRHEIPGHNSRLDELQAAILSVKLAHLEGWIERRRAVAARYRERIRHPAARHPVEAAGARHVYHLYPLRVPERDRVQQHLAEAGIQTLIHYPLPLHLQPAFADLGYGPGDFPHAEAAAASMISLPLFPQIEEAEVERVAEAVEAALAEVAGP
ncbi:MAG: DegT/DnrJ/EryC1/StrS family aminotransferase [Nitrospirae bacterium]|nr:MAG: DegT/DnrJ/EryC1/StrS family aminotransferase [Nitrospirota bacterium]